MQRMNAQSSMSDNARRGSALLIVIGTLALIAVFAAIYITIGQGDRRAASTVRERNNAQDIQNIYAGYIAGVIASDRTDVYTEHLGIDAEIFHLREITDAPFTDWTMRSESNDEFARFNATGRHILEGEVASLDFRAPSDPWLASTRPTYLGDPNFRPFSSSYTRPELKSFLDNRDWLQITNLAPDGRFVNLFNLRPQTFQGGRGGFNSEPGVGITTFDNGDRVRRMSEGLSLLKLRTPGDPDSALRVHAPIVNGSPTQTGYWLPGFDTPQGVLDPNIPAHWTMYQRFMFFPIDQPYVMYDRNNEPTDWSSPDYAPYQYADADGDGMADSRWFELTSAQTDWGTQSQPRDDINRMYDAKDFRVFAAARVIDLSSLVNVNTATDGITPPTGDNPFGVTPAEVDLRRLLTMQDAASMFAQLDPNTSGGYLPISFADLHRPTIYRGTGNDNDNQHLFERSEADYTTYVQINDNSTGVRRLNQDSNAILVGRYAYDALRMGIHREYGLTGQFFGNDYFNNGQPAEWLVEDLVQYTRNPLFTNYGSSVAPEKMTAEVRRDQYRKVGRIDPTNPGVSVDTEFGAGLYGMDDLAELLTFHGINDPAVISRLERVASGRLLDDGESQDRLSPLLSNRPLELDRYRHGSVRGPGGQNPNRPRLINGKIADESMQMFALSPRKLMTTISGGVGLRPTSEITLFGDTPRGLTADESQLTIASAANDPQALFGIYSRALAGELRNVDVARISGGVDSLWPLDLSMRRTDPIASPYATLFYGYRGPEFAYRVAAHAAVNMKDLNDNDDIPTVATVLISDAASPGGSMRDRLDTLRDDIGDDSIDITTDTDAWLFPGEINGLRFEVPQEFVRSDFDMSSTTDTQHRRAFNVYGVEPMPVISEVSSIYVYTDAPEAVLGDRDYNASVPSPTGVPSLVRTDPVTIEGGIDPANPDFLMQLLAVQITNPFDEPIAIGGMGDGALMGRKGGTPPTGTNSNNFEFLYYLEYNGRFFKLGEFQEYNPDIVDGGTDWTADGGPAPDTQLDPAQPSHEEYVYRDVTLDPGESRVFYALAQERFDNNIGIAGNGIDDHWFDIMSSYGELPARFDIAEPTFSDPDGDGRVNGRDGRYWTGLGEEWVQSQLSNGGGVAVHMHQFDPTEGTLVEMNQFTDLFTQPITPPPGVVSRTPDATQVRLWRKYVATNEEYEEQSMPAGTNATRRNLIENDILVDRFYLDGALDNALAAGNQDIDDTVSFAENQSGIAGVGRNDNTGLTMVRWKTQRRKDTGANAVGGLGSTGDLRENGQVGPWMIQSRRDPASTRVEHDLSPIDIPSFDTPDAETFLLDNGNLQDPYQSAFVRTDNEVQLSLRDLWRLGSKVVQTLPVHPGEKSEITNDEANDGNNNTPSKFTTERMSAGSNNANEDLGYQSNAGATGPKPEIYNKHLWSAERVADLLLTTGIGITYAPDPERAVDQSVHNEEWITFPEAMAIALGYETPLATDNAADSIWFDAVLPASSGVAAEKEYALQDLHLSIDRYVPFLDLSQAPVSDPNYLQYTPGTDDIRRGTGAPMALALIDSVRGNGWLDLVGDNTLPPETQALFPLTRPTFGKININTAPVEVLRLLPGLTPSLEQYHDGPNSINEWWANETGFNGTNLPDLLSPVERPDIAAGIVAYRDRVMSTPRFMSDHDVAVDNLSFEPFDVLGDASNNFVDELTGAGVPTDRARLSGINGLRGTPGFGSLGEVLAVTLDSDSTIAEVTTLLPQAAHLTVGYYGLDGTELGVAGIDTDGDMSDDDYSSIDPQVYGTKGTPKEGVVDDDYAERLAVANGILNSISVRSDYYAVWFVVQGFRPSDIANLGEYDPLVPSFMKRYLMVVDRTNVLKDGQQPRILMLKEVPL